jgi:mRNA-degrading endonuclease RelE of RelBE toxin-antitoxin system
MRYAIVLAPSAAVTLRALPAFRRSTVKAAIETHLRHEPTRVSKSRIKRLRGLTRPQYRLRVDEERVFYDVIAQEVQVLAIVAKEEADGWLKAFGEAGP